MPPSLDVRRKRIKWQSAHRGMRETDIALGRFAAHFVDAFSADQLDRLETLLDEADIDILDWIIGRKPVPEHLDNDIMGLLKTFDYSTEKH